MTTQAGTTTGGCTATITIGNSWPGGFQGALAVRNDGTAAVNSWTVSWTLPAGQAITQIWSRLERQRLDHDREEPELQRTIAAGATYTGVGCLGTRNDSGAVALPTSVSCGP